MINENKLIKWIWERRLTTSFNIRQAINLIEEVNEQEMSNEDKERIEKIWNEMQEDFNIKNIGKTFICLECKRVFTAGSMFARCCGKEVGKNLEEFFPEKHGHYLVGLSNSWTQIEEKINKEWKHNPIYQKVWEESTNSGSFGSSTILIDFVEELIRKLDDNEI